jgi:WD40 repeat protein
VKFTSCYEISATTDEALLAVVGRRLTVVDALARKKLRSFQPLPHPSHADFSPDTTRLAVKSTSGRIVVTSRETGEQLLDCANAAEGEGTAPWFSPCGEFLIDASWSGRLRVRSSRDGSVVTVLEHDHETMSAVWPTCDRTTWFAFHQPKTRSPTESLGPKYVTRHQWPFQSTPEVIPLRVEYLESSASAVSPLGDAIAFGGRSTVATYSTLNGQLLSSVPISACTKLRWSSDGSALVAVLRDSISVLNAATLQTIRSVGQDYAADAMLSSKHGYLLVGGWSGGHFADDA